MGWDELNDDDEYRRVYNRDLYRTIVPHRCTLTESQRKADDLERRMSEENHADESVDPSWDSFEPIDRPVCDEEIRNIAACPGMIPQPLEMKYGEIYDEVDLIDGKAFVVSRVRKLYEGRFTWKRLYNVCDIDMLIRDSDFPWPKIGVTNPSYYLPDG